MFLTAVLCGTCTNGESYNSSFSVLPARVKINAPSALFYFYLLRLPVLSFGQLTTAVGMPKPVDAEPGPVHIYLATEKLL